MTLVVISTALFTTIVLLLVGVLLVCRSFLVSNSELTIDINSDPSKTITTQAGSKLLRVLSDNKIYVSSACGGQGTCGQCTVKVLEGGGSILPVEHQSLSKKELIKDGMRLSCQLPVKENMKIQLPREVFDIQKIECEVVSSKNMATLIKEITFKIPDHITLNFEPGEYIQIECPPHKIDYKDMLIDEEYIPLWDKFKFWRFKSRVLETTTRAYSMANYSLEKGLIKLNVRLALPPKDRSKLPPGKMSSYLYSLRPKDKVTLFGPYGHFFPKNTNSEMIYIGGGVGIAPLRAHVMELLRCKQSNRKINYWQGFRNLTEAYYLDEFQSLAKEFPNFTWNLVLSSPMPQDKWKGLVGYVHQSLYDNYLKNHNAPEECEYYFCGPPQMNQAILQMLTDLGVPQDNMLYDDFGI